MMKKILWYVLCFIPLLTSIASGYKLEIPKDTYTPDVNATQSPTIAAYNGKPENAKARILGNISFINGWLWIALWFICFGFVVYNGFKLVTARGEQDTFKKATKGLLGAGIGIVICFLSYGIIRVIINLF